MDNNTDDTTEDNTESNTDTDPGHSARRVNQEFRELTRGLIVPYPHECLICFLFRFIDLVSLADFPLVRRYASASAPRATGLVGRLMSHGAYSDGDVIQWAVVANPQVWDAECCRDCGVPLRVPACLQVRLGSTQPCRLWRWRREMVFDTGYRSWIPPGGQ
ncbi:hypothetical protein [Specibacter sp. RAF43]|uniref:hypothetical protein n=1 Tax=Specibacter sp. RAF43 TaxID=3233057 RepID=UPI003F9A6145